MASFTLPPAIRSSGVVLVFPAAGVTIPAGAHSASIAFTMPVDAERANSSQHMDYGIELQIAPSTNWKPFLQAGWNGGTGLTGKNSTVLNPPPTATVAADFFQAYAGNLVRISVQLKEALTLGGTVTVI